jgi:D-3-phosphoglycerate dehydrogenase
LLGGGAPAGGGGGGAAALARHPSVVCTHHIGAATQQAQAAVGLSLLAVVRSFAIGELENRVV